MIGNSPIKVANLHGYIIQRKWTELGKLLTEEGYQDAVKTPNKDGLFPLLMACERRAPTSTIQALLFAFPSAAAMVGMNGNYPLHHAAQLSLPVAAIAALIKAYPDALDAKNDSGMTPKSYRQNDEKARESLHRSSLCWKNEEKTKGADSLRRIAFMREQKWEIENRLNDQRSKLKALHLQMQGINSNFDSVLIEQGKQCLGERDIELLEQYCTVELLKLKKKMTSLENRIGEELADRGHEKEMLSQKKHTMESIELLNSLRKNIEDSRTRVLTLIKSNA